MTNGICAILLVLSAGLDTDRLLDIDFCLAQYQENRTACGPISAWYSLRILGHDVSASEIRAQVNLKADGVDVAAIVELLRGYEPQTEAIQGSTSRLESLPVPSILIIGNSHCVTLVEVDAQQDAATVFEPRTCQLQDLPLDTLRSQWSGKAIVFAKPSPSQLSLFLIAALSAVAVVLPGYWLLGRTSLTRV